MKTVEDPQNKVKTTSTVFTIIESLEEGDGVRISELANELGLAKSTVHRHLATLCELEYVVKEGDEYHLGLQFLGLGEFVRNRKRSYQLAREKVEELGRETEERAQFIVEEHGLGVCVHRAIGRKAVKADLEVGKRVPMHATSAGKSILANLPSERLEAILDERGLPRYTENTITDRATLYEELEVVRSRGFGINNQEHVSGLKAVGVPVIGPEDQVIGSLSVSGPAHRMKGEWLEETLPDLLLGTANELELNIAYG
jgi:DNA-binding IclR family transcriptional regulator